MDSARSDYISNLVIIGEYRASITISTKRFGWKKAGACHIGKLTNRAALPFCAKALRCIVDKP